LGQSISQSFQISQTQMKGEMVYNESILILTGNRVKSKGWVYRNVLIYLFLFLLSFLVFDSTTLMIGVFVALIALYHFSAKLAKRNQL